MKKPEKKIRQLIESVAGHPYFGAFTAIATVLAGGLASFFTDSIKESYWPFFVGPISWGATAFWFTVGLAGTCLGAGQWAQAQKSDRAAKKLESMVAKLETLPTGGFLPEWKETCRIALQDCCLSLMNPQGTITDLEQRIRNVLGSIAIIAQQYDKAGEVEYAASIMLWRECDDAFQVNLECSEPVVVAPWFQGDQRAQGVLELVPSLSTAYTGSLNNFSSDPRAVPLVLPVPIDTSVVYDQLNKVRTPVLPGATWAFVHTAFAQFPDVSEFARWIDDETSIDAHAAKRMKDYFRESEGKHIQSFGSVPILVKSFSGTQQTKHVGVLNLHSAETGLLADNGQTLFVPLLEPFLVVLSVLLLQREDMLVAAQAAAAYATGQATAQTVPTAKQAELEGEQGARADTRQ
jgi:hypothetical protein